MMKKRNRTLAILVTAIFFLFLSLLLCVIKYAVRPDLREIYPYAGYSTLRKEYWEHYGEDRALSDGPTGLDVLEFFHGITCSWLVARKDIALAGKFLPVDSAEVAAGKGAVLPEAGTNEYGISEALAEDFGSDLEQFAPTFQYHTLLFQVEEVVYSKRKNVTFLSDAEKPVIAVFVANGDWEVFPDITLQEKVLLFGNLVTVQGTEGYLTSSLGYYYISKEQKLYSAEAFQGLDELSGISKKDFFELVYQEACSFSFPVYTGDEIDWVMAKKPYLFSQCRGK